LLIGFAKNVVFGITGLLYLMIRTVKQCLFSMNRKAPFQTITGKGPGEVIAPTAFNINKKDTTILLYQQMLRKFSRYDFNGK